MVIEEFFASSEDHSYPLRFLLTERQLKILQLIAEGKSTEEIGRELYMSPELTSLVIEKFFASSEDHSYPLRSLLTERQLEILQLIAEGKSTEEIGRELYLSPKTVDWHCVQLKKKLGLDSTVALVKYAIKEKLTNVDF